MGLDVQMYVEVRRGDVWRLGDPLVKNPYFDPVRPQDEPQFKPREVYEGRNYELFAILANIGNPVRADEPFECVSYPRGLPPDVSAEVQVWHDQLEGATWAESWLLLGEILRFDWHGKEILRRAMVDDRAAHLFPPGRRGFPYENWPAEVNCGIWESGSGTEVRWKETYAEAVGDNLFNNLLPKLQSYGAPEGVRIVFWFNR